MQRSGNFRETLVEREKTRVGIEETEKFFVFYFSLIYE